MIMKLLKTETSLFYSIIIEQELTTTRNNSNIVSFQDTKVKSINFISYKQDEQDTLETTL